MKSVFLGTHMSEEGLLGGCFSIFFMFKAFLWDEPAGEYGPFWFG